MPKRTSRRGSPALAYLGSILALGALLADATPVAAAELRQGDSGLISSGETIHDDLYVFGQTVTILGTVDGDVFAAGSSVTVAGVVTGSVSAAGGTVSVTGDVRSLRAAGGSVAVSGPVAEDALLAGGTISLAAPARVGRDLLIGGSADIAAPVSRNLLAGGQDLALSAPVGGDVRAEVGSLRLGSGASVAGALSYTSDREAEMAAGASVAGPIQRQPRPAERYASAPSVRSAGGAAVDWLRGLVGVLALGLVLVLAFPRFTGRVTATLAGEPWPSLGLGLGLLVGTPLAALLLFVLGLLVGGWWLGLMLLMLYGIRAVVGYALAAAAVGQWLLSRVGKTAWHPAWALLAGLIVLGLIGLVPVLGGVVLSVALAAGLGAGMLLGCRRTAGCRLGRARNRGRSRPGRLPPPVRPEPFGPDGGSGGQGAGETAWSKRRSHAQARTDTRPGRRRTCMTAARTCEQPCWRDLQAAEQDSGCTARPDRRLARPSWNADRRSRPGLACCRPISQTPPACGVATILAHPAAHRAQRGHVWAAVAGCARCRRHCATRDRGGRRVLASPGLERLFRAFGSRLGADRHGLGELRQHDPCGSRHAVRGHLRALVTIADLDPEAAVAQARRLSGLGLAAQATRGDVRASADVAHILQAVLDTCGHLDIWVNNAGIYPVRPVLEMTEDDWDRVLGVNLKGTFLCSQAAERQMIAHGQGGVIINIASIDAVHPSLVGLAHYDASKGGMLSFTKSLALELAPHNIRVLAIAPGGITTEGTRSGLGPGIDPEEVQKAIAARIPLRRMGVPDDIGRVAPFLASDAAASMTGTMVFGDGGELLA